MWIESLNLNKVHPSIIKSTPVLMAPGGSRESGIPADYVGVA